MLYTVYGKLVWQPELRFTANGTPLCTFRIDKTDCELWDKAGQDMAMLDLKPDQPITVKGYWKTYEYKDREGKQCQRKVMRVREYSLTYA